MANVKLEFNYDELNLLHGGLGHYYDYLENLFKLLRMQDTLQVNKNAPGD